MRRWTKDIDPTTIPDKVLYAEAGRRANKLRVTHAAGPGRPALEDRCPCGIMTRDRAEKRNHNCQAPLRKS
jgi:hypothetical protein